MTNPIIERCAKAMCNAAWKEVGEDWSLASDEQQDEFRLMARAVLEALREPTKAMLDAGITAAEDVEDWTRDSFERYRVDAPSDMPLPIWLAMLTAALSEDSPHV